MIVEIGNMLLHHLRRCMVQPCAHYLGSQIPPLKENTNAKSHLTFGKSGQNFSLRAQGGAGCAGRPHPTSPWLTVPHPTTAQLWAQSCLFWTGYWCARLGKHAASEMGREKEQLINPRDKGKVKEAGGTPFTATVTITFGQDEELSLSVNNSLFLSLTHSFHVIFLVWCSILSYQSSSGCDLRPVSVSQERFPPHLIYCFFFFFKWRLICKILFTIETKAAALM